MDIKSWDTRNFNSKKLWFWRFFSKNRRYYGKIFSIPILLRWVAYTIRKPEKHPKMLTLNTHLIKKWECEALTKISDQNADDQILDFRRICSLFLVKITHNIVIIHRCPELCTAPDRFVIIDPFKAKKVTRVEGRIWVIFINVKMRKSCVKISTE